MEITRRGFLTLTGAIGSGITLSSLGINLIPTRAYAE
jgi:formate dehydrogenase major subunit